MDQPPPAFFSGRRRSSVGLPPPPSLSQQVAPRKASTWDDTDAPPGNNNPVASQISARRSSENSPGSIPSENSAAGSIAGRKASNWDDSGDVVGGGSGGSASEIAGRRATETDQPPWDRFCGPPPGSDGSTWGWMADIDNIATRYSTLAERNRVFYTGNVNYIFDIHTGHRLSIKKLHTVLNAYGVHDESVKDISKKIDPEMHGFFSINTQNKQNLLTQNTSFVLPSDPLKTLRHASECLQGNLLSPIHFSGYIFDILISSGYVAGKPPFMLLGTYGILGVLSGSNQSGSLSTKDVETFVSIWKRLQPEEAEELKLHIIESYNGSISCYHFYNLLYRRNVFGKQRIQMFDTKKGPLDPSLYLFALMHKDEHHYLEEKDIRAFSSIFSRNPSDEEVARVIRELDFDNDGKVSIEDIRGVMTSVLDGMTWEFWLVAILFVFKL